MDWCISGTLLNSGLKVPFPSVLSLVGGPHTFLDDDCCDGAGAQGLNLSDVGAESFCHDWDDLLS